MKLRPALVLVALTSLPTLARADGPAPSSSTPPAQAPAPAPTPEARLSGHYVFVGGEAEISARNAAIDKATDDMFFAIKGTARSKLREKTPVRASVSIAFAGGNVTVTEAGAPPATSPTSGASVSYKNADGDVRTLTQRLVGEALTQTVSGENGARAATFTVGADGKTLTLAITITSPHLPKPVQYRLTYRRS